MPFGRQYGNKPNVDQSGSPGSSGNRIQFSDQRTSHFRRHSTSNVGHIVTYQVSITVGRRLAQARHITQERFPICGKQLGIMEGRSSKEKTPFLATTKFA